MSQLFDNLGGWYRLWIAASIVWFIPLVGWAISEWPNETQAWSQFADEYIQAAIDSDDKLQGKTVSELRGVYPDVSDRELVLRLDKEYTGRMPFDRIALNHLRRIDAIPEKRTQLVGIVVFGWLMPVFLTYVFGRTFAWIRAGFKKRMTPDA